jgi:phosphatidylserine decarboxylase
LTLQTTDLLEYPTLGAFICRPLAPGSRESRPIADSALISPADGTVLHFCAVQGALVEQLKGLLIPLTHLSALSVPDLKWETEAHCHHDNNDSAVFCPRLSVVAIVDNRELANVTSDDEEEGAPEFPTDREAYERPSPPPMPHKHGVWIDASVVETSRFKRWPPTMPLL